MKPVTEGKKAIEASINTSRFHSWDMLCGKFLPELGGQPKYLDIIGANYYIHNQQWIVGDALLNQSSYRQIAWDSPARRSFTTLLAEVYERYDRPIVITETGSFGEWRGKWWRRTLREMTKAQRKGIPIAGICAYPVIDQEDWGDRHLTHAGLWDFKADDPHYLRIPHQESIDIIKRYITKA
jgi:UDP-galactopyranose mutase